MLHLELELKEDNTPWPQSLLVMIIKRECELNGYKVIFGMIGPKGIGGS